MVTVAVVTVGVVMGGAGPDHVNHPGPIKEGNDMTRLLTSLQTRLILLCPTRSVPSPNQMQQGNV